MDAELDIDLSGTDGHSVTDNNKKSDLRDAVDDFGEEAADKDREVSSGRAAGSSRRIGKARA
ncbi:BQ5605_C048g12364 [Microbotryum silenes-dioicae]|uniref:BQ5605_C048g12364 protein n=1 Tax=Microbotryum silenes-dioicae TaxID=796604 RepID=A0A2X0NAW4_9BASI|nr:BQ5605_C048g12364 [Microbotryum silenes-dioicae]